jgi:hypothetical protein
MAYFLFKVFVYYVYVYVCVCVKLNKPTGNSISVLMYII